MISAGEFRNGVTFDLDGQVFQVVDFMHVKPGKGAAFVRTKLRNVLTGATVERTFNPADKMPRANIEKKDMQYLYKDDDLYYFMDVVSYEQIPISKDTIGDTLKFITENTVVMILSYKGNVFGIEPPNFVELMITQTEPGYKGDTATGTTKYATLETGAQIKVPLFVNEGDTVKIDTRSGDYMERA
jgi:elongation factor P